MPNNATAKTKSAPKPQRHARFLYVVLLVVVLGAALALRSADRGRRKLEVDGRTYVLLVAKTPAARGQGLGGRASMPANQGMLFVFSSQGEHCFWMKNMRFPLDIIWLDGSRTVTDIRPNVSPTTYPHVFCPAQASTFVIELNAGQAAAAHLAVGQTLVF